MKKEKICGIYKIENLINKKVYIGQSVDINTRFRSHKSELKRKNHSNRHIQNSYDKYGLEGFNFSILEICDANELDNLEIKWIKVTDSTNQDKGYNLESGGSLHKKHSKESRARMSESIRGMNHPFYGIKFTDEHKQILRESKTTNIPILQFDLDGKLIKRWEYGAGEAGKKLNIDQPAIFKCLKMTRKTFKGYIWLYEEYYNKYGLDLKFHMTRKSIEVKVVQLSKENSFIKLWNSVKEAQEFFNISHISEVCRNKKNSTGGFKWMYKENYEKQFGICTSLDNYYIDLSNNKQNKNPKSVSQYDLEGNFIATFESAREAERVTGVGYKMISRVCNGNRPYTHGFIWEFAS